MVVQKYKKWFSLPNKTFFWVVLLKPNRQFMQLTRHITRIFLPMGQSATNAQVVNLGRVKGAVEGGV
jgi:hypothetical protein